MHVCIIYTLVLEHMHRDPHGVSLMGAQIDSERGCHDTHYNIIIVEKLTVISSGFVELDCNGNRCCWSIEVQFYIKC